MVEAASTASIDTMRARSELNCCVPCLSPPTTNATPSTSTLLARIEPTSAAWTTLTSPSRRAKSAMKSSGRLPRPDWTTLAPPEPSREPSCSVAVPTRRARSASAAAATTNVDDVVQPGEMAEPRERDRERR